MQENDLAQTMAQAWFAQGKADGKAEAKAEWKAEGARGIILRFGQKRLGAPDANAIATLNAIADFDRLERISDQLEFASSWSELLAAP
jgi:hypothetical protein